jgi:hypothetical protein
VGLCAIFEHFPRFEFFLLPNRIHARPRASQHKTLGASLQNKLRLKMEKLKMKTNESFIINAPIQKVTYE